MLDPAAFNSHAAQALAALARISLSAAGVALLILTIQYLFARWITPTWRYRLWAILVIRLLLPALPPSPASLANVHLADRAQSLWTHLSPPARNTTSHHPNIAPPLRPQNDVASTSSALPGVTVTIVKEPLAFPPLASTPSEPATSVATPSSNFIPTSLFIIWSLVALLLFIRLATANIRLSQSLKHAIASTDPTILSLLHRCCAEIGIRSVPPLLITPAVRTPAAAGVFKPRILLPPGILESLSPVEQRAVLLHELAHIRRHDVATNWLLALLQILHWFNPILWIAFARLRADRELARDAMVLSLSKDDDARQYVHTLLKLTESLSAPRLSHLLLPAKHQIAVGMYGNKHGLKRRLAMITQFPPPRRRNWIGPALAVLLAATMLTAARSQISPETAPPSTRPSRQVVKVPVLSQVPILGSLFTSELDTPATRPAGAMKDIPSLIQQSRAASDAGHYAEALQLVDQILTLDPADGYAVGVKPWLEDKVQFARQRQYVEQRIRPADNKVTPADQQAIAQLDRQLPSLTFDAVGFSDVIDFLRDVSGMNIFVNWKSVEAAGIDRQTPVSANLRNVKFSKAVSVVLESVAGGKSKLGYTIDQGVLTITTADDLSRNVVVRVYDIRDLIVVRPDYQPADSPAPPTTRPTRDDLVKLLTKLIMDVVDTKSWTERGGPGGSLREVQGQLIVTQTLENHREIANFLAALREENSIQIFVEARYISLDEAVLKALMDEWNRSSTPPRPTSRPADHQPPDRITDVFLTQVQVNQLLQRMQSSPNSSTIAAPRMTLSNAQRAFVKVSSSRAYLGEYAVVVKGDGQVRYEPVNSSVDPGITMDMQAIISADRKAITLNLRPKVSALLGFTRVPWAGSPPKVELMVERPQLKSSELLTTVTIPEGNTALLGGLEDPGINIDPANPPATRPAGPPRALYLLVTPTLVHSVSPAVKKLPLPTPTPPTKGETPGLNDADPRKTR